MDIVLKQIRGNSSLTCFIPDSAIAFFIPLIFNSVHIQEIDENRGTFF